MKNFLRPLVMVTTSAAYLFTLKKILQLVLVRAEKSKMRNDVSSTILVHHFAYLQAGINARVIILFGIIA